MLQFTDPERLGNKEGPKRDVWISLEGGNRRDFMGGLTVDEDVNMSNHVLGQLKVRILKETTGKGGILGSGPCFNCRLGLPRFHRDLPVSASRVLGLKVCATTAWLHFISYTFCFLLQKPQ